MPDLDLISSGGAEQVCEGGHEPAVGRRAPKQQLPLRRFIQGPPLSGRLERRDPVEAWLEVAIRNLEAG